MGRLTRFLASPIFIGILLTSALSYFAWQHLRTPYPALAEIERKLYDIRLNIRGPQPPAAQVAVLAVDNRSIEKIGRWPWPRDIMAKAIQNAFNHGAKVIAADLTWSEPTNRPEKKLIETLNEKSLLPKTLMPTIDELLNQTDADRILAETLGQHRQQFVMGHFFSHNLITENIPVGHSAASLCLEMATSHSPLVQISQRTSTPLKIIDNQTALLPPMIYEAYKEFFTQLNPENILPFCTNAFLNSEHDDIAHFLQTNWPAVQEEEAAINQASFSEWRQSFLSQYKTSLVPEALDWVLTIPLIAEKAELHGFFNATLDPDGSVRRSQLVARSGTSYIPSIALLAYLVATNQNAQVEIGILPNHPNTKGIRRLLVGEQEVPVTPQGTILINYSGPGHSVPHASLADLLDETSDTIEVTDFFKPHQSEKVNKSDFLKNKILVLGVTATAVYDLRVTPFDGNFPGVETHANVIANFLEKNFLKPYTQQIIYLPILMLVLGLLLTLGLSKLGAISGLFLTLICFASIFNIEHQIFFKNGLLTSFSLPIFQITFTYLTLTIYKYFTEERSKKELRTTFSKYVSPAIVEEILKDPKNLELGGRKETVTVFFSDVRDFTTISEKLDPRALSDLLNSYLTPMTDIVFKNRGTLDKYMGDAIMAFFGAPVHYEDHAYKACQCALQSLTQLKELQAQYKKKGLPELEIGIGLNTGECSVGNMGSETVRSYTVMGDAVNLASRLEGINKTYGTHVIISEFTYELVKNDFLCREIDWVRVKGKLKPVKIYELIAEINTGKTDNKAGTESAKTFAAANPFDYVTAYNQGYSLYHAKKFSSALTCFETALKIAPDDRPSQLYQERCRYLISSPPPDSWDGIYDMKTK